MTAIKNLLNENKKVLQCLHFCMGYNFEKPYRVIEGTGKFTVNTLYKLLNEDEKIDTAVTLLIKPGKCIGWREELHLVYLTDRTGNWLGKFVSPNQYKELGLYNDITYYWRKSDLEADRKSGVNKYWLVIQKKEYLTAPFKKAEVDYTERMKPTEDFTRNSTGGCRITYVIQGNSKIYANRLCKSSEPIDKSGYFVEFIHAEYKRRVKALIAERKKEEANVYDCSIETDKIRVTLDEIRKRIAAAVSECTDHNKLSVVDSVFSKYRYVLSDYNLHVQRVNNNSYSSVYNIKSALGYMDNKLNEILDKLNEYDNM